MVNTVVSVLSLRCYYESESKVLQYFGKVKHNSASLDTFAKVMKVMNHTRRWDAEHTWYWVLLARFVSMAQSVALEFTVLGLPDHQGFSTPPNFFFNQLVAVLCFQSFGCLHGTIAQCSFQITHGVKQCTTCQRSNYYHIVDYELIICLGFMAYQPLKVI